MRYPSRLILFTLPALLLLGTGCTQQATGLREGTLAQEAAWPLGDKAEIENLYAFVVLPDGDLFATDSGADQLFRLGPDGTLKGTIGGKGSGPLEFRQPTFLSITGDTLAVYDSQNRRLVLLGTDGTLRGIVRFDPAIPFITGNVAAGPGGIFVPTGGMREGGLILRYGRDGKLVNEIGDLEGPATMTVDTDEVRAYGRRGESAPAFRSRTWVCPTPDGGVIAIYLTMPRAARFAPDGSVRWQKDLEFPDAQAVRDASQKRFEDNPYYAGVPNQYWRATCPDGSGGAYLVLNAPDRLIVYHLSADGDLDHRYLGPEGSYMQIATAGDGVWVYRRGDASLHRFRFVP